MMKIPSYEGIRLRFLKIYRNSFVQMRRKRLSKDNFTIFSNNCWGGMIYEMYGIQKLSPTIGLFFMADDYIKFLKNFDKYINCKLVFIKPEDSIWRNCKEISGDERFGHYPIGVLNYKNECIEIFFLHAHSESEASEKWRRRCLRINRENLIVKFNDQNGCTENHIKQFINLPFKNKVFFTSNKWENEEQYRSVLGRNYVYVHQVKKYDSITASHEPFPGLSSYNVTAELNRMIGNED